MYLPGQLPPHTESCGQAVSQHKVQEQETAPTPEQLLVLYFLYVLHFLEAPWHVESKSCDVCLSVFVFVCLFPQTKFNGVVWRLPVQDHIPKIAKINPNHKMGVGG